MRFFKTPSINFIGNRHKAMIVSAVLLLVGAGSVVVHKGFRMSIDFAGGALVEIRVADPIPLQDIRDMMADAGFSGAEVTLFGADNEYLVKVKAVGDAADVAQRIKDALAANIAADEIDIRRYLGPDYCPDLRVREGTEMLRRYERGKEDDPDFIIWQASIGDTARECLYDLEGNLILRIGVSGRVLAGPKGGPGVVNLPLRIAVVKYQEAVLYSDLKQLAITIPAENSTVFRNVYEVTVPSPGRDRDYLIYVGFDEDEKGDKG